MRPPVENTPRVPRNITRSRIDNFMAGVGQFHSMGIHSRPVENEHNGEPHVSLSFYSVPDLQVSLFVKTRCTHTLIHLLQRITFTVSLFIVRGIELTLG